MELEEQALLFTRPYAGGLLRWHIIRDPADSSRAPDVVFEDPSFCPLLQEGSLAALLDGAGPWDAEGLQQLLEALLALWGEHQRGLIAALDDDRIQFELAMVQELGCTEMALAGAADGAGQKQACFSIPVAVDLQPAQRLLARLQQQQQQPPGGAGGDEEAQRRFVLHAGFRIGAGPHAPPDLRLQSPPWAAGSLPAPPLPSWDPQASLLEYVTHLAERLDKHLQDHCPAATLRFDLLEALAAALGPPLEACVQQPPQQQPQPQPARGASGGGAGGGSGGGGGGAPLGGRAGSVFHVTFDQQPLLLFVELPAAFPAEPPALALQSVRRLGPDSRVALPRPPWSPRWPADEMAARLFNFVKQEAAAVARKEAAAAAAAAAGGTAAGAGAVLAGGSDAPASGGNGAGGAWPL